MNCNGIRHSRPNTIVLLLALALLCSIASYSRVVKLTAKGVSSSLVDGYDLDAPSSFEDAAATSDSIKYNNRNLLDEAEFIIQKSYAETYARMFPCPEGVIEQHCIKLVVQHLHDAHQNNNNVSKPMKDDAYNFKVPTSHPYPWWFQTLLRDIPSNGSYGWWHHFRTNSTSPPLKFCAIGSF